MTIVVTGATGNVGRPLVAELAAAGARVRAVTRTPDTAGFPPSVEVVGSAADALPGASAVFLNSRALGEDLAERGGRMPARRESPNWLRCRRSTPTTTSRGSRHAFRGDRNKEVEQLAVDSGLAWVSLRPTVFATNFAGMWSAQIRAGDVVAGPYAAASTAPIVESDIAAVAARALLTDELVGQRIPLTGPQAFTNSELVRGHRRRAGSPAAVPGSTAGRSTAAVYRLGVRRRVRRRLYGHARRDARQTRTCHPRRGEDSRPRRQSPSRSGCPSTATCTRTRSPIGVSRCPNHARRATSNR